MNWTGGKLQRHSHGTNNTIPQKQRQHFARVRTRVRHASQTGREPLSAEYLKDRDITRQETTSLRHYGTVDRMSSDPSQSKLDDYAQTRPLATRLASLASTRLGRHDQQGIKPRVRASRPAMKDLRNSSVYRLSPTSSNLHTRETRDLARQVGTYGDVHESQGDHAKTRLTARDDELALLQANRQRFLGQDDWVALAPARPVTTKTNDPSDRTHLGKRRKHPQCRLIVGARDESQVEGSRTTSALREYHTKATQNLNAATNDIRVCIGSDALNAQSEVGQNREELHLAEVQSEISQTFSRDAAHESIDITSQSECPTAREEVGLLIENTDVIPTLDRSSSMLLNAEAEATTILDFTRLSSPYCTTLLRDLGCTEAELDRHERDPGSPAVTVFADSDVNMRKVAVQQGGHQRQTPSSPESHFRQFFRDIPYGHRDSTRSSPPASLPHDLATAESAYQDSKRDGLLVRALDRKWDEMLALNGQSSHKTSNTGYLGMPNFGGPDLQQCSDITSLASDRVSVGSTEGRSVWNTHQGAGCVFTSSQRCPDSPSRSVTQVGDFSSKRTPAFAEVKTSYNEALWKQYVFGSFGSDEHSEEDCERQSAASPFASASVEAHHPRSGSIAIDKGFSPGSVNVVTAKEKYSEDGFSNSDSGGTSRNLRGKQSYSSAEASEDGSTTVHTGRTVPTTAAKQFASPPKFLRSRLVDRDMLLTAYRKEQSKQAQAPRLRRRTRALKKSWPERSYDSSIHDIPAD